MLNEKDNTTERYLGHLQEMGLTHQEALVYYVLTSSGPSQARRVSEITRLSREHSYQILKKLEAKGLVEVVLAKPSMFVAVEPRVTVSLFISRIEDRSEALKDKAYELGVWLQKVRAGAARCDDSYVDSEPHVRLLFGKQVFTEFEKEMSQIQDEYMGILPTTNFHYAGGLQCFEQLAGAAKRGIRARLIMMDLPDGDYDSARRLSRNIDVRHHAGSNEEMRFSLFDRSRIMLALHEPVMNTEEPRVIYSSNPALVKGFVLRFEQLWSTSTRLDELRYHRAPVAVRKK